MIDSSTRSLTGAERANLDALLAVDFPGVKALRAQAATALVSGGCDCGCPTIYLTVNPSWPVAEISNDVASEAEIDQTNDSVLLRSGRALALA